MCLTFIIVRGGEQGDEGRRLERATSDTAL